MGSNYVPMAERTPEEREAAYRHAKMRRVERERGQRVFIPTERAAAHTQALWDRGMSLSQMRRQSGLGLPTLTRLLDGRGAGKTLHRDTERRILAIRFESPPPRAGRRILPHGTRRRLQALVAAGFPTSLLAQQLGMQAKQQVHSILRPQPGEGMEVFAATAERVRQVFEKLDGTSPSDLGATRQQVSRALGTARRNGFAPAGCWDLDRIDDPDAFPEWTGACGTVHGLRIHWRERIPECRPCLDAKNSDERSRRRGRRRPAGDARVFDREAFARALKLSPLTREELAERTGMEITAFQSWQTGRTSPRTYDLIDKVATALGRHPDEFYTEGHPT